MSKLEKLYNSIQNLKDLGVEIPETLMEETRRVEQEILANDLIPSLSDAIKPIVGKMRREMKLVIWYRPREELKIEVNQQSGEIASASSINIEDATSVSHTEFEDPSDIQEEQEFSIANPSRLIVYFPDGTIIREGYAAYTFFKTIERIGALRVKELGLKISGVDLVSETDDSIYMQRLVEGGYFVCTHSSTKQKKQILDEISDKLKLNLKVEII
ncbi:hypothetical protein EI546_03680 [Aequorivita sp. H23M31]|uniref:Uncharacterized protein n=1 Tax=Aequorivita ciconiae TaxID=2494375 RepID=A0A410G0T7_9FLAO|nr:hypothetical protein [Aequorivita sp. H23M31]QAA80884.1 hypothetical protein EI546_03680 [Aequorivita sp. H23M31]